MLWHVSIVFVVANWCPSSRAVACRSCVLALMITWAVSRVCLLYTGLGECPCTDPSVNFCFHFLSKHPRSGVTGPWSSCMFTFMRNCDILLRNVCNIFTLQPKLHEFWVLLIHTSVWYLGLSRCSDFVGLQWSLPTCLSSLEVSMATSTHFDWATCNLVTEL